MARIKKTEATDRESFMLEIFKSNPDISIAKANDKLFAKTQKRMRAQRAYELRDVAKGTGGQSAPAAPTTASRRSNNRAAAKVSKPTKNNKAAKSARRSLQHAARSVIQPDTSGGGFVLLEGSPENMRFLKSAFEAMASAGVQLPEIDHASDTYAVVRT